MRLVAGLGALVPGNYKVLTNLANQPAIKANPELAKEVKKLIAAGQALPPSDHAPGEFRIGPLGYVLQEGAEPAPDSIVIPGAPLLRARATGQIQQSAGRRDRESAIPDVACVRDAIGERERFPARLEWLVEVLDLERDRLPVPFCAELEDAIATIAVA